MTTLYADTNSTRDDWIPLLHALAVIAGAALVAAGVWWALTMAGMTAGVWPRLP